MFSLQISVRWMPSPSQLNPEHHLHLPLCYYFKLYSFWPTYTFFYDCTFQVEVVTVQQTGKACSPIKHIQIHWIWFLRRCPPYEYAMFFRVMLRELVKNCRSSYLSRYTTKLDVSSNLFNSPCMMLETTWKLTNEQRWKCSLVVVGDHNKTFCSLSHI